MAPKLSRLCKGGDHETIAVGVYVFTYRSITQKVSIDTYIDAEHGVDHFDISIRKLLWCRAWGLSSEPL